MPPDRGESVVVVASTAERAEAVARELSFASVEASFTTDLARALEDAPAAALIDPCGWEGTCRAILSAFPERRTPPPAVFLVGGEQRALYEAGPAMGLIREPFDARQTAAQLKRALLLRRSFSRQWPRVLQQHRSADLGRVEDILVSRTGHEIRPDRRDTFRDALVERLVATLSPTVRDYERLLTGPGGQEEVLLLACLLVVGETCFWRYSGQMYALEELLSRRTEGGRRPGPVRLWSAGCSTGEEPYSLAMAARRALGVAPELKVWGTDLDPVALEAARRGRYAARSLRNLPPDLLEEWLDREGTGYRIKPSLQNDVHFERQNLFDGAVPAWIEEHGPFDAIFLRNVNIYFGHKKARLAIDLMVDALAPGGGLFLGAAETLLPLPTELDVRHEPGAFYYVRRVESFAEEDEEAAEAYPPGRPEKEALAYQLFREGLDLLGREDFGQAEALFTELLHGDPASPLGHTGLAVLLANQGREVEAMEHLDVAVQSGEAPTETYFLLGLLHERAARPDEALASYDRTIESDPDFLMAHFNRALIHRRQRKDKEFRAGMRRALGLLKTTAHCPAWVTGGIGFEALAILMANALEEKGPA